jgi:hypothetical protein
LQQPSPSLDRWRPPAQPHDLAPADGGLSAGSTARFKRVAIPPREYALTDKGRALAPIITALTTWGDTWAPTPQGPPVLLIHEPCGHTIHPIQTCPHCHGEIKDGDLRSVPGPGATSKATAAEFTVSQHPVHRS